MTTASGPHARAGQFPLELYFRDIDSTPLLTPDEEKALSRRVEQGDDLARDRMVRANLRLVVSIARAFVGRGLPLEDLIAEGNLGLLRAVEGFDPDMNTRFSTYASHWIKQSIKLALANTGRTVRIPVYMAQRVAEWGQAAARLADELGRPPTRDEVAGRLGLCRETAEMIASALRTAGTLPLRAAGEEWNEGEAFADKRSKGPDVRATEADEVRNLMDCVGQLSRREAEVLRLRFGLTGGEPRTLREI